MQAAPAAADPATNAAVSNATNNGGAVTNGSRSTTGNSGQSNNSGNTNGGGNTGVANTGQSNNVSAPPPGGPAHPTSSGTALADETSVASGSGLALDNSVASGDAVALHGSVASGCSVAIDHSTASGGTCRPAAAKGAPSNAAANAAGVGGGALAFTGLETLQMTLAGALALALGALLVAFAGMGRREEATA